MNYKHLFPTYRGRYLFVRRLLTSLHAQALADRMLNLGAGEGDLDPLLASYARELYSCDLNAADVEHARRTNAHLGNVQYQRADAEYLAYASSMFDTVCCIEVIEHVGDPQALLSELHRVLKPGGYAIVTCPSDDFPLIYDPVNRIVRRWGQPWPIGAYAYGHTWLVKHEDALHWFAAHGLCVLHSERLAGPAAALVECYVPGLLQKLCKANAANGASSRGRGIVIKPRGGEPPLMRVVDAFVALDAKWTRHRSVGLGYLLQKALMPSKCAPRSSSCLHVTTP